MIYYSSLEDDKKNGDVSNEEHCQLRLIETIRGRIYIRNDVIVFGLCVVYVNDDSILLLLL